MYINVKQGRTIYTGKKFELITYKKIVERHCRRIFVCRPCTVGAYAAVYNLVGRIVDRYADGRERFSEKFVCDSVSRRETKKPKKARAKGVCGGDGLGKNEEKKRDGKKERVCSSWRARVCARGRRKPTPGRVKNRFH